MPYLIFFANWLLFYYWAFHRRPSFYTWMWSVVCGINIFFSIQAMSRMPY